MDISAIKLLIVDIDGVLAVADRPLAGAKAALERLAKSGFSIRYLTNDAYNSRAGRASNLAALGFDISASAIYTASSLTATMVRNLPRQPRTLLLGSGDAASEFSGVRLVQTNPEVVVIGDCSSGVGVDSLNQAMSALLEGAKFFAMQKNRTFPSLAGTQLDCGLWVAGLEYCSRRKATVAGKPSRRSYLQVCDDCNVLPAEALMISDSLDPDLRGAKSAGLGTAYISSEDKDSSRSRLPTFHGLASLAEHLVTGRI